MSLAAFATREPQPAAQGSSFYLAMKLLPRDQRHAMFAVYAFCRAVDDIADRQEERAVRAAQLDAWRAAIDDLYDAGRPPGIPGLADAVRRFDLDRADFHAVVDGMAMDVAGEMIAPNWPTLDLYCERVASAVGRLSVRIFGLEAALGRDLAHSLGRALQLTNILRDIDEDAALGRLYLPREALEQTGLYGLPLDRTLADPRLDDACRAVVGPARAYFVEAARIMDGCSRDAVRAPRIMAAAYRSILEGLVVRGWRPPRSRVSPSRLRLVPTLVRSFLFR